MKSTVELNEQTFDQQVLNADKPIVVDFWADWCGPCKMLAPSLEEIAGDHHGRALIAKVNIDENPELVTRYQIQSIPTLLYFSGGELRDRSVGVVSKKEITNRLAALLETRKT
jgi:thioredoxin 1